MGLRRNAVLVTTVSKQSISEHSGIVPLDGHTSIPLHPYSSIILANLDEQNCLTSRLLYGLASHEQFHDELPSLGNVFLE
jgi:hypothetical protein